MSEATTWEPVEQRESSYGHYAIAVLIIIAVFALAYHGVFNTVLPKEPVIVPASVEDVVPCNHQTPKVEGDVTKMLYSGPGYMHRKNGTIASHCRPCEKARSKEENFVCNGDAS
jgi:hypothetical protein